MAYDTIVLSGNSTNAVLTMGGIQVLHDKGQLNDLKYYVGTSSGSILGCLMSVGYNPLDLLCYLCINKPYS
jgi:predicted acylesterase/phospholipase RssA